MLYSGEFFPDVDEIARTIERKRFLVGQAKADTEWRNWKAANAKAQAEGRAATSEQIKEIAADVEAKWQTARAVSQSKALGSIGKL